MQLAQLIEGLQIKDVHGTLTGDIKHISHNSKTIGSDGLFVALKGSRANGHDYIPEAIASGATALIIEEDTPVDKDVSIIKVPDARVALATVADCFYQHPSRKLTVIGITGTNGKTTISYLLESILKASGYHPGVIGTIDYRYGQQHQAAPNTTPNALDLQMIMRKMLDAKTSHLILEVSSHALEQHRVEAINFDIAVFSNLSPEHLDYHGTMEQYGKAKELLFTHYINQSSKERTYAVINYDDPLGRTLCTRTNAQLFRYGSKEGIELSLKDTTLTSDGLSFLVNTPQGEVEFKASLIGRFNIANILAAVGTAMAHDIPLESIRKGITQVHSIPGRLERIPNEIGLTILVDYAHTSDALEHVLATLKDLHPRRLITVFGCGGDRDTTKRGPMGDTATRKSDLAIITSDNPRTEDPHDIIEEITAGIDHSITTYYDVDGLPDADQCTGYSIIADRRAAIRTAVNLTKPGDILLVAGKGHEDYQIIGNKRYHFSDREEITHALSALTRRGEALH
jgi:UDP-N-acetylmuramoyl-L-alanyl-D-glutamate--2,6-diaminopimelate ligase